MWEDKIKKNYLKKVLIVAHGNSQSFSNAYTKNNKKDIINLNIPTGIPMAFRLRENLTLIENYYLGDEKLINKKSTMSKIKLIEKN